MASALKQLHRGYQLNPNINLSAKPNVYRRSYEARETTDSFLLAAAGRDLEAEEREAKRNRAYKQAAIILLGVALCVGLWLSLT